jgi:hypothetical protein
VLVELIQAAHAERARVLAAEASGSAANPEDGVDDDEDDEESGDDKDSPSAENKSPRAPQATPLPAIAEKGAGEESDSGSNDTKPPVPEATPKVEARILVDGKPLEDDKKDEKKDKKNEDGTDASENLASFSGSTDLFPFRALFLVVMKVCFKFWSLNLMLSKRDRDRQEVR